MDACIHVSMLHLPEEWLRSNGLRTCRQDRPPNIVNTWRQFLYTGSVGFSFFERKKYGLNCWREEKFLNRWNGGWFQCPSLLNFKQEVKKRVTEKKKKKKKKKNNHTYQVIVEARLKSKLIFNYCLILCYDPI